MNPCAQSHSARAIGPGQDRRNWLRIVLIGIGILALVAVLFPLILLAVFTSPVPQVLPNAGVTQEDRDALISRWLNFEDELKMDHRPPPFHFSSRELNVFIDMMPRLRSRVYAVFEGDRLQEQFCVPLQCGSWTRYLKGTAAVAFGLKGGELTIDVISCRVNGHPLPRWICRHLGRKSLNPEAFRTLERFEVLPHLQSIEVRDGCVVLTPRQFE